MNASHVCTFLFLLWTANEIMTMACFTTTLWLLLSSCWEPKGDIYIILHRSSPKNTASIMDEGLLVAAKHPVPGDSLEEEKVARPSVKEFR